MTNWQTIHFIPATPNVYRILNIYLALPFIYITLFILYITLCSIYIYSKSYNIIRGIIINDKVSDKV